MTNRYNILNLLFSALVLLLPSCISLEDYETDADRSKTIEFVCRPTSYDGQEVLTKATTVDDFENKVHNCYFMLYDNSGTRVYGPVDLNATLATQRFSKSEFKLNVGELATYTACFIANVSKSIVDGLNTLSKVNSTVLDIAYSSADVSDTDNSYKPSSFVVPEFVLEDGGKAVQCLPMFGMQECNVAADDIFQISLKRLFAKVTVSVGLGRVASSFDVMAAHLFNLPTKVKLSESSNESEWVEDVSSFLQQQIEGPIGHQITSSLSSAYELYFYVPEYYLNGRDDRSGNYGNEKFKPNMYDTDKNPVLFRLFGEYGGLTGGDTGVQYDLYLGENAATSFTLKRNKHYINSMVINGITNRIDGSGNTLDCRVTVSEEGLDEVEIIGQTANCYIIGKTGSYIYPACKGVHKGGLNNIPEEIMCFRGTDIEIIAQNNENITLKNLAYNRESKEFSFDITNVVDGSAVVALTYQDGGEKKIEWSWHLWFVSGFNIGTFETDWFDMKTQSMPNGKMMMDRNLGANVQSLTPGTVNGFYYKYGYKDPFFTDVKYNAGTKYHGGGDSTTDSWGGVDKSQTDPCPPGYRVPDVSIWDNPSGQHGGIVTAFKYSNSGSADIYYPYSGCVNANMIVEKSDYSEPQEDNLKVSLIPKNQSPWTAWNLIQDPRTSVPYKDITVKYNRLDSNVSGWLSGNNSSGNNALYYGYIESGHEIIECSFTKGTWDVSGFISKKYTANYTNPSTITIKNTVKEDGTIYTADQALRESESELYERINRLIQAEYTQKEWWDILGIINLFNKETFVEPKQMTKDYGYQVRCVKE